MGIENYFSLAGNRQKSTLSMVLLKSSDRVRTSALRNLGTRNLTQWRFASSISVGISSETVGWIGTALQHVRTGYARVHQVEDAVDGLVAARAEDRGAKDPPCVAASMTIFMKPCVSSFSMARPTRVIGRRPRGPAAAGARLWLRHAHAAERRIDVERVADARSLTLRSSPSSRFAATISKSL